MGQLFDWAKVEPSFKGIFVSPSKDKHGFATGYLKDDAGNEWDIGLDLHTGRLAWLNLGVEEYEPDDPQWKRAQRAIEHQQQTDSKKLHPASYERKRMAQTDELQIEDEELDLTPTEEHHVLRADPRVAAANAERTASVRVHEAHFARLNLPNAIGIAHSRGVHVYFSVNPNRHFVWLVHEGVDTETPNEILTELEMRRGLSVNKGKTAVVVIEGSEGWCRSWANRLDGVENFVFVSAEEILRRLGVPILDEDWKQGDPIINVNQHLAAKRAVSGNADRVEAERVSFSNQAVDALGQSKAIEKHPFKDARVAEMQQEEHSSEARSRLDRTGQERARPIERAPVERPKTVQRSTASGALEQEYMRQFNMGQPQAPEIPEDDPDDDRIAKAAAQALTEGFEAEETSDARSDSTDRIEPGDVVVESATGVKGRVAAVRADGQAEVDFEDTPPGQLDAIPVVEIERVTD